jgi:uncharacterized protein (TIGR03663 family)
MIHFKGAQTNLPGRVHWVCVAAIVAIAFAALITRSQGLSLRPMHGDEANQAHKFGVLLEKGEYRYDPNEHHGPTLYYFTLPVAWLRGEKSFAETDEATYRIVPLVFSIVTIMLLLLLVRGIGNAEATAAALLMAVSPAMYFYSRYYIQETLLACYTLALLVFAWRYTVSKKLGWAVLAGISLGLMHATKETFIVALAAMVAALAGCAALEYFKTKSQPAWKSLVRPKHLAFAIAAACLVSLILFSSFFTYARGPLDSVLTYATYFHRAGSEGEHNKPWHYYLHLLLYWKNGPGPWWSEAFVVVMAAIGGGTALLRPKLFPDAGLARFLTLYTLFLTGAYSIIQYKTPWCLLSFYTGMLILAGMGCVTLVRIIPTVPGKGIVSLALLAGVYHLGEQAHRATFVYPADRTNPYVYAHTSRPFLKLVNRIEEIAGKSPQGHDMLIRVFKPDADYWPLPFYLRKFKTVGYWTAPAENMDAPIIITSPDAQAALEPHLLKKYKVELNGFRYEKLLVLYIDEALVETVRNAGTPPH